MPRQSRYSYEVPEYIRSDLDRECERTDACVCCGAPGTYPVCRPCQVADDAAFAEDMANGDPWTDIDLPLPKCRSRSAA